MLHAQKQSDAAASKGIVPKVDLGATHEKALGVVDLAALKGFAIDGDGK